MKYITNTKIVCTVYSTYTHSCTNKGVGQKLAAIRASHAHSVQNCCQFRMKPSNFCWQLFSNALLRAPIHTMYNLITMSSYMCVELYILYVMMSLCVWIILLLWWWWFTCSITNLLIIIIIMNIVRWGEGEEDVTLGNEMNSSNSYTMLQPQQLSTQYSKTKNKRRIKCAHREAWKQKLVQNVQMLPANRQMRKKKKKKRKREKNYQPHENPV